MSRAQNIFFYTIIIIGILFRILFLDRIPSGINDDELHFVINSKAISYGLNNFYGNNASKLNEYSSWLFSPIIGALPLNLFDARLPYAVTGIIAIILIFNIVKNISKNVNLALACALVTALNPWSIYVSRTSFDAPIAMTLFLTSFWLLTHKNIFSIILSIIFGYFGFNSYIGTKTIYFPLYLIINYFSWRYVNNQKFILTYLLSVLTPLFITIFFITNLTSTGVSGRTKELISLSSDKTISLVNIEKNQSLRSPFKLIYSNSLSVSARLFINKYLESFSSSTLFTTGDRTFTGSLWKIGYFYYLDALLIVIGFIYLYQFQNRLLKLLLAIILIAPIPEAIRSDELPAFVFHSVAQFPIICIFIGAGSYSLCQKIQKNKIIVSTVIALYLIQILNFVDIYFFKSPIYQSEGFAFSRRIISNYLIREEPQKKIFVLTNESNTQFRSYLFYSNLYSKANSLEIASHLKQSNDVITFNNITFTNTRETLPKSQDYILLTTPELDPGNQSSSKYSIYKLSDNAEIYRIYRSDICHGQVKDYFSHNLSLVDLSVEKMDNQSFCNRYLSLSF